MARVNFEKNENWLDNPGTWWHPGGHRKPVISCPKCGLTSLGDVAPHTIEENGDVNASVICGREGCDFHEFIHLLDWHGGRIK